MILQLTKKLMHASITLGMIVMLLFNSCSFDQDDFIDPTKGITTITFSVNMPNKTRSTYALTEDTENNVSSIYVLAFKKDNKDGDKYKLADWSATTNIKTEDSGKKTFATSLTRLEQGDSYKFVLLANASQEIASMAFDVLIKDGIERDALLNKMKVSVKDRWDASGNGRDIPMWGETDTDVAITDNINVDGISMVRMLAKIDVLISGEAPSGDGEQKATDYFKLNSVHLYNAHNTGHLVPASGNMSTDKPLSVVEKPTLVDNSATNEKAIIYDGDIVGETALTNTIYTFESEVPKDKDGKVDTSELTSLVIGGFYDGETTETFYRLDIKGKKGTEENAYLDILRNHRYTINIVRIKGSGYNDADEAFKSKPINMEAEIVEWNETQVGDIHESDGYNLSIYPESEFQFYKLGGMQEVTLTTNHPLGWKVTKVTESDGTTPNTGWLTVDKTIDASQGANGNKVTMEITTTNTSVDRAGYIYVKFAKTEVRLTVNQSAEELSVLEITSNGKEVSELLFTTGATGAEPQALDVSWISDNEQLQITNNEKESTSPFVGTLPSTSTFTGASGSIGFIILPTLTEEEKKKPIERETKLDFKVSNNGVDAEKSVNVKHINYGLMTDARERYILNGNTYSFIVTSNARWKIKSIEESVPGKIPNDKPGDNLKVDNTIHGADNKLTSTRLQFSTISTFDEGAIIKIVFASAEDPVKFEEQEMTIQLLEERPDGRPYPHNGWAGSNIYWDGEKMTFDDVLKNGDLVFDGKGNMDVTKSIEKTPGAFYQGLYFKWGSLWGISPVGAYGPSTILYSPNGKSGPASSFEKSDWNSITNPETAPKPDKVSNQRDYAYLTSIEFEDGLSGYPEHGDICKYLSEKAIASGEPLHNKKWRMPTSMEFESFRDNDNYSNREWNTLTSDNAQGKLIVDRGKLKFEKEGVHMDAIPFTASGNRNYSTGYLSSVGPGGFRWSSSPNDNDSYAYYLEFYISSVNPAHNHDPRYGFSVRCVVDEIVEE